MSKYLLSISLILITFVSKAQLNGNYTIGGTGANYSTVGAAISALGSSGVSGPVTFSINPGTYSEQITIPIISGASTTNRITFKSSTNDSTSVQISYASGTTATNNYALKFNNSHFINFQYLTIKRTGSNLYSNVVEFTANSSDISFSSCVFKNDILTDASYDNCLIKSDNAGLNGSKYIKFSKNRFINGSTAILIMGKSSAAADLSDSIIVANNYFENQYREGMSLLYCRAPQISGNIFSSTSPGSNYKAIALQYCMAGIKVVSNTIQIANSTGIYIQISSGDGVNTGLIANNMIAITGANSTGIWYENSAGHNIYFNSILLSGTGSKNAYFSGSSTLNLNFENNILSNSGGGQCISTATNTSYPFDLIDYNDYYTTGSVLGTWKSTSCSNLTAWKNANGMDISSLSVNPQFISSTNLHLNLNSTLCRKGSLSLSSPFPTTDIDGRNRHTIKPDIGADEFSYDDLSIVEASLNTYICQGQSLPLSCKIKNKGTAPVIGNVGLSYKIDNNNVVTEYQYFANFAAGDSFTYVFTSNLNHTVVGNHSIKIYPIWINDTLKINDTLTLNYEITAKINLNLGNDTTICANQSIVLDAGTGYNSYVWNTNAITQTITVDTNGIGLGGKFFRVTVSKNGCTAKDSILIIFVSCAGIQHNNVSEEINVFPNPASKNIKIVFEESDNCVIEILDENGRIVYSSNSLHGSDSIDISGLKPSVYFIKMYFADSVLCKKFIKY